MLKKIGFNIMLFVFIMVQNLIISCTSQPVKEKSGILLKTDREFSAMSEKEGMFRAFLSYIAEDGVILRDNSYPEKGKESLLARFEGRTDTTFVLTWEPLFEMISESGDLGYTYGIHKNLDKSTGVVSSGTYVTIWQKQADGSWRFVLDSGTQGLPVN
jgi:ketosteroid isomerase-like protein